MLSRIGNWSNFPYHLEKSDASVAVAIGYLPWMSTTATPFTALGRGGATEWFSLELMHALDQAVVEASWKLYWDVSRASVGADAGSAIFGLNGRQGLTLYFTPSAENLAKTMGAVSCAKPAPDNLRLIAGDEGARSIHFEVELPGR